MPRANQGNISGASDIRTPTEIRPVRAEGHPRLSVVLSSPAKSRLQPVLVFRTRLSSVAGGERQRGRRRQQLGAALDLGGPGAGEIALGREHIEYGRQPRRPIRLERRLVGLLGRSQQREGNLTLAERRLHVCV